MVLEWGGDEDTAIAALLHDAVEDQGGEPTAELIRERFGDRVAGIVLACTDSVAADGEEKAPWEARKLAHIEKIRHASSDVAMVTAADKMHNLKAMLRDVQRDGAETMKRFKQPDRIVWYYSEMAEALQEHAETVPLTDVRRALAQLDIALGNAE